MALAILLPAAVGALRRLFEWHSTRQHVAAAAAGGIPALIELLGSSTSAAVKASVAAELARLCSGNLANLEELIAAGGIPVLLQSIGTSAGSGEAVLLAAVSTLHILAGCGACGLPALVRLLGSGYSMAVQEQVAQVLMQLVRPGVGLRADLLAARDAEALLLSLQQLAVAGHGSPVVQQAAAAVLSAATSWADLPHDVLCSVALLLLLLGPLPEGPLTPAQAAQLYSPLGVLACVCHGWHAAALERVSNGWVVICCMGAGAGCSGRCSSAEPMLIMSRVGDVRLRWQWMVI